jgi:hypothetical protein
MQSKPYCFIFTAWVAKVSSLLYFCDCYNCIIPALLDAYRLRAVGDNPVRMHTVFRPSLKLQIRVIVHSCKQFFSGSIASKLPSPAVMRYRHNFRHYGFGNESFDFIFADCGFDSYIIPVLFLIDLLSLD